MEVYPQRYTTPVRAPKASAWPPYPSFDDKAADLSCEVLNRLYERKSVNPRPTGLSRNGTRSFAMAPAQRCWLACSTTPMRR